MKKPITIKIPNCPKCKKQMDVRFTTEREEGDKRKPKIIVCYGVCDKCETILVFKLIKTKNMPGFK